MTYVGVYTNLFRPGKLEEWGCDHVDENLIIGSWNYLVLWGKTNKLNEM